MNNNLRRKINSKPQIEVKKITLSLFPWQFANRKKKILQPACDVRTLATINLRTTQTKSYNYIKTISAIILYYGRVEQKCVAITKFSNRVVSAMIVLMCHKGIANNKLLLKQLYFLAAKNTGQ